MHVGDDAVEGSGSGGPGPVKSQLVVEQRILIILTTTRDQLAMTSPGGTSSVDLGASMRAIDSALK